MLQHVNHSFPYFPDTSELSSIFHIEKYLAKSDVNQFLTWPLSSSDSPNKGQHHGHVLTNILKIFNKNKLNKLFIKSKKYKEPQKNVQKVIHNSNNGTNNCIITFNKLREYKKKMFPSETYWFSF